jgi:hypothetical protein
MAVIDVTNLASNRTFTTAECDGVVYHRWTRLDGSNVYVISVDEEVVYDDTKRKHN